METKGRKIFIAALAVFSATSTLMFVLEFQSFDKTNINSLGRHTSVEQSGFLPVSHSARMNILRSCDRELSPPLSLVKTGQRLKADSKSCLSVAQKILKKSPSFGFSYLVAAKSHAHLGQHKLARRALAKSTAAAPFEGWQIQRRLRLSLELSAPQEQLVDDISALLTTQTGAELAANFYIKDAGIRRFVDACLNSASKSDRARFFNLYRKYSALS